MMPPNTLMAEVRRTLGSQALEVTAPGGEVTVVVRREDIVAVLTTLRDTPALAFVQLMDLCGVDYPARTERFDVVYHLLSLVHNVRVRVIARTDETTPIPSVREVYGCAVWFEREAWDMFGLLFEGNTDLRRLLTEDGFEGHPLRKDFPLMGYTEVRYDPVQERVVHEPLHLMQDFRAFDTLSPWEGRADKGRGEIEPTSDQRSLKSGVGPTPEGGAAVPSRDEGSRTSGVRPPL